MDPRSGKALVALRRILRATDLNARALGRATGLSTAQLVVLQSVAETGRSTPKAIAQATGVSQATITALLDKLEAKRLVARHKSDQDRRQVLVLLTETGRNTLDQAPDPLQGQFVERYETLPDWERGMIMAALERVAHLLDAGDLDASPLLDTAAIDESPRP